MRRRTIIIFTGLLLLISGVMNPLSAQLIKDENLSRFDDRVLHFGFYLGANTMGYRFTHFDYSSYRAVISDIKPGFSVGGVINLRMNNVIDFRFTPGMSLGSRQVVFSTSNTSTLDSFHVHSSYLDFPVGFRYKGNRYGNLRPYIYGGGAFKWDLENKRNSENRVYLKRAGYYAEVAFGLDSYFPFFRFTSEFRFSYGLNNIISNNTLPFNGNSYDLMKLNSNVFTLLFFFE